MTDHLKDGGPAFPREYTLQGESGMSLRDWFAGQALANSRTFFKKTQAQPQRMLQFKLTRLPMQCSRSGQSKNDRRYNYPMENVMTDNIYTALAKRSRNGMSLRQPDPHFKAIRRPCSVMTLLRLTLRIA
jgi:hypothetical protein